MNITSSFLYVNMIHEEYHLNILKINVNWQLLKSAVNYVFVNIVSSRD